MILSIDISFSIGSWFPDPAGRFQMVLVKMVQDRCGCVGGELSSRRETPWDASWGGVGVGWRMGISLCSGPAEFRG